MTNELETYRSRIDALDEKIIALIKQRIGVVKQVGEFKQRTAASLCPIRPGREASMLRRISEAFADSDFNAASAAQIWRLIIGASTALEAELSLSVYAPNGSRDLFWLAREYFGPAASISRQPHINRVVGDVMDGKAAIGIVPPLSFEPESNWWSHLLQPGNNAPKIFAHLPFVYHQEDRKHFPSALALSRVMLEDSGDDVSLYVLDVDHDTSQHRLQGAFGNAGLSANWITIGNKIPNRRHHVIEVKGYVPPEDSRFQSFIAALGGAVTPHLLGIYALPFTIAVQKQEKETA